MRIRVRGYAGDCTVSGQLELGGDRASDVLDRSEELVLAEATLYSLDGQRTVAAGDIHLQRDDLFVVEAEGPPGPRQRRVRTVRHLLRAELGPYVVYGELHALPGTAPLRTLLVRRSVVPLTNAVILYRRGARFEVRRAAVLIVNARLIDGVETATAAELESELARRRLAGLAGVTQPA